MRKAGQFCINLRDKEWNNFLSAGMIRLVSEDMPDFYELTDMSQYTEEEGLNLSVEIGMGIFG